MDDSYLRTDRNPPPSLMPPGGELLRAAVRQMFAWL
jgi:hypothetical protein